MKLTIGKYMFNKEEIIKLSNNCDICKGILEFNKDEIYSLDFLSEITEDKVTNNDIEFLLEVILFSKDIEIDNVNPYNVFELIKYFGIHKFNKPKVIKYSIKTIKNSFNDDLKLICPLFVSNMISIYDIKLYEWIMTFDIDTGVKYLEDIKYMSNYCNDFIIPNIRKITFHRCIANILSELKLTYTYFDTPNYNISNIYIGVKYLDTIFESYCGLLFDNNQDILICYPSQYLKALYPIQDKIYLIYLINREDNEEITYILLPNINKEYNFNFNSNLYDDILISWKILNK